MTKTNPKREQSMTLSFFKKSVWANISTWMEEKEAENGGEREETVTDEEVAVAMKVLRILGRDVTTLRYGLMKESLGEEVSMNVEQVTEIQRASSMWDDVCL